MPLASFHRVCFLSRARLHSPGWMAVYTGGQRFCCDADPQVAFADRPGLVVVACIAGVLVVALLMADFAIAAILVAMPHREIVYSQGSW